jgi:hypothetical protein
MCERRGGDDGEVELAVTALMSVASCRILFPSKYEVERRERGRRDPIGRYTANARSMISKKEPLMMTQARESMSIDRTAESK